MTAPDSDSGEIQTLEAMPPAKINLFLLVGRRRADGYHPICSLMEKVSLHDRVRVRRTGRRGVRILGSAIPAPGNTVFRAAAALEQETGVEFDIDLTLEKEIPQAAGLAGGSSDAAAVLKMLIRLFCLDVGAERLDEIALGIGADVPFFLRPGPMIAEGAGELLGRPPELPEYHAVVVRPEVGLATAEVYELYDTIAEGAAAAFPERRRAILERLGAVGETIDGLAGLLANDLEAPAIRLCPEIGSIKEQLLALGAAGALMSGSGTSVFGLFAGKEQAIAARQVLAGRYSGAWLVQPLRP